MSDDINQDQQAIINDEVLRSRIRELTGKPESKPRSAFTRFSSNPLAPLLVGFILTGVVGSSLTYYYTERQKQNEAARHSHEKSLESQRTKEAQELEYVRKQNLLDIENNQHLNAQALEAQRTKDLRATEAARAARERDIAYARSQMNVVEDRKIEQARVLEILLKHVNSDDPSQRTFGYEMFVYFGHGELAAKIISQKGDPAGRSTLIAIQNNSSQTETTKQFVSKGLAKIGDVQLQRILTVISIFTTGRGDGRVIAGLKYVGGGLVRTLETYVAHPEGKFKDELTPYIVKLRGNAANLDDDPKYKELLEKLDSDPIMIAILEQEFRERWLKPALQYADQVGVKTVLGLAAIIDANVHSGPIGMMRISERASQELNGSPQTGVDEKVWIKTFVEVRRARLEKSRSAGTHIIKLWLQRVDFFVAQMDKNNWDLLPPFQFGERTFAVAP